MKKLLILSVITFIPTSIFAMDNAKSDYQQVLDKYLAHGEMNAKEVEKQKISVNSQKKWRPQLKNQARDVASTLKGKQKILKLENPIIEISTN